MSEQQSNSTRLVLASGSKSRAALMRGAGIRFEQITSHVDEDHLKATMREANATTMEQAEALAELKARKVSLKETGIVFGADQMLDLEGAQFDKPKSVGEARENLLKMRGKTHTLETALVACQNGAPIWRTLTRPQLKMRNFTEDFLDRYLGQEGDDVMTTVGAYKLEGRGVQLFERIEGDYFSILGLPLIQMLDWLRDREILVR